MARPKRADVLRDIASHGTEAMKIHHPMSMIQIAFEFFGQGCVEEFAGQCAQMDALIERTSPPARERDRLRAEPLLLEAFGRYNCIAEMGERMRRASELSGGRTSLVSPSNSWSFGNASVLFMYHRQAGRLADMRACTPCYVAMSGGHGGGGPELMEAEALLCRGQAERAEIFGHKARHQAASHKQTGVAIGAQLLFGRLALLRGDGASLSSAVEGMSRLVEENPQKSSRQEADMARSFLMGLLGRPDGVAEWIGEAAFAGRLFTPAMPFA